MGKWTKRGVLPPSDVLIEIARLTQCNLHWLLTGQGEADTDPLRFLPASTREVVLKFSEGDDRGLEPMVVELVEEALLRRASEMLANRRLLSARQIDQLLAIVNALSLSDEETPAAARRRPAS